MPQTRFNFRGFDELAFDFETHLIGPDICQCGEIHEQFPPAVCMSWCLPDMTSGVCTPAEGIAILEQALEQGITLIGAETAFDVFVACVNCDNFDSLLARFVEAYEAGRVHDVCLRQKHLDLAAGEYRWMTFSDGRRVRIGYDLATTAKRLTGIELSKPTKENKYHHPRLRYAELDGVPIAKWPAIALAEGWSGDPVEYAREDAVATMQCFLVQENWRDSKQGSRILDIWDGASCPAFDEALDPLRDCYAQTMYALWLKAMAGEGVVIDPVALEQFERRTRKEYIELCKEVRGYGLLRREYWRDLKRLRALKHPYRDNKLWKALKEELDHDLPEAHAVWDELLKAGLVRWKHVKCQAAARARMFEVCLRKHKPIPRTDKYDPDTSPIDACIAIDSDSCRLSEEVSLVAYAELTHCGKMLTGDIPQLRKGVDRPIHTHFEVLLETGRISSAGPNITNRARGEGKEVKLRDGTKREGHAGDRECFTCRDGNVIIDCDYPQGELFCLAQVCNWVVGYSTLGDALLNDIDPHTDLAVDIYNADPKHTLKIDYKRACELHKQKLLKERDAAKGENFGKPGGLGAETMVSYAAKSYGVVLNKAEWEAIGKIWEAKWTEMPEYFKFVNSLERDDGTYAVPQAWSGRLRGGATYCAACNTWYQGLLADIAKRAGWYIFKACYVPGFDPILFGCMPVNFIHDQFLVEAPKARAAAAAKRVEYWMGRACIEVLPDYGQKMADKTEAILCARYSKMAEKTVDENGELVAWEDKRLQLACGFSEDSESDEEESDAAA